MCNLNFPKSVKFALNICTESKAVFLLESLASNTIFSLPFRLGNCRPLRDGASEHHSKDQAQRERDANTHGVCPEIKFSTLDILSMCTYIYTQMPEMVAGVGDLITPGRRQLC